VGTFAAHTIVDQEEKFAELYIKENVEGWRRAAPIQTKTIWYHPRNNLPICKAHLPGSNEKSARALEGALCATEETNKNLDESQKELLRWHFRLGHVGFSRLRSLIRHDKVKIRAGLSKTAVANCKHVMCSSCEYGKACRRPTKVNTTSEIKEKRMELKKGDIFPGQRISVDHYQSAVPGRPYSSRGSTDTKNMYHGGAIFVDHASGYLSVKHQVSLSAADTIKAKLKFEREASESGVIIQGYHTDNGTFNAKEFMEALTAANQKIRFSGAGGAHQNGVAER